MRDPQRALLCAASSSRATAELTDALIGALLPALLPARKIGPS